MNEQKKTVREWLNELPEPIRTRAVDNTIKQRGEDYLNRCNYLGLDGTFVFDDTSEEFLYWSLANKGRYSEACALLGETLQTEQAENTDVDNSILDGCMENVAQQEYGKFWFELDDSQKAHLVVPVAIRYAELVNNQKQ